MKGYSGWSYRPYRPLMERVGEPYICRLAPSETAVQVEWLATDGGDYRVYARPRGEGEFALYGTTRDTAFTLEGLTPATDYELYVAVGEKQSRVRLARTGACVDGVVVNYLHPDDEAYAFSGRFLCSPSLVRLPDGGLLASMDVFEAVSPQNLTLIFRSDDNGKTWRYQTELMPCFWGKMFLHKGDLYMLACTTEYGDLVIGRSSDGGRTFSAPVTLLRGSNGKNGNTGVHKNPQNVVLHNGRLYGSLEWGAWRHKPSFHAAMVMSCDAEADLLVPENWSFSEPVMYEPSRAEHIEGTLVADPEGKLLNIMRIKNTEAHALVYEVNTADPDAPLGYSRLMDFPAHLAKFSIRYDEVSGCYYTIANRILQYATASPIHGVNRSLLSLMRSNDLYTWEVVTDVYDYSGVDDAHIGFQYTDFFFEGDDLYYLCRVAFNGAPSFHDANYSLFRRLENFRNL